jgi:predicted AAA+ superfamily ATPase
MGIHSYNDLLNHPHLGNSWEGFVIEQIINHLPTEITPWFYRTHQGAECDLLLEKNGKVFAAIEIQHSKSPKTSKGFHIAMADTKAPQGYLIGNGEDTYKIGGNITITNLVTFFNLNFLK